MDWTESDSWRVAHWCSDYDALPFIHMGTFGPQVILMPHKVYPWRDAIPKSNEPKQSVSPLREDRR
jgi:hypothetical protein